MKRKYTVRPIISVLWVREDEHGTQQPLAAMSVTSDGVSFKEPQDAVAMRPNEAAHIVNRESKMLAEGYKDGLELKYEINPEEF